MYYIVKEENDHFYQASELTNDYLVTYNGKEISLDEYLIEKENDSISVFKNCFKLSA